MTIETLADAIGATRALYRGRSNYLFTALDWWCDELGPSTPILAITTDAIDEGIRTLMESPALQFKRGQGVVAGKKLRSSATVNRYVGALATMYKLLRLHRQLPRSFVSPIVRGLKLPEAPGRTLQVTLDDVRKLVAAARLSNNRKLPALIAVACTTGLRKGSIQDLVWGAVDLRIRTLDVPSTKNGTPTRSVLPQWVAAELARIRPVNPDRDMPVFGKADFKRAFKGAVERAELPDWTFHHCRHIAASILAQSGASLIEVMQVLNHKSPSMALRYSHLNTRSIDAAVSRAWG
jgi:integrase